MDPEFVRDVNALLISADDEHRKFEEAHAVKEPKAPQPEPGLTRAEVTGMIREAVDIAIDGIALEVSETEKELRASISEEFERKLGELRAEVTVSSRGVVDLGKWRSDADAA
jgi:hypothetical protein